VNAPRSWFEKDFYTVLGVAENATAEEIKRAYKKLARANHPDANPGNKAAEERMKELSEAYAVLGDASKRGEYDDVRRLARSGYAGAGGFPGGVRFEQGVPFDIGDIFGDVFGGRRARARAQRGPDLEARARVTFEDAVKGATIPIKVRRDAPCKACAGTGDASGRAQRCSACGGSGTTNEDQGFFSVARACRACGGGGRVVSQPCPACGGSAVERVVDEVRVKVPPGIKDGARIRVRGRGGAVAHGETGDLYVVVDVTPHEFLGRDGDNLTITVPVSYADVALGALVVVPTLDGTVTLNIPAGTQPGRTFRVRGKGVPKRGGKGDLLVKVQVEVPTRLSLEERELIEKLAELRRGSRTSGEPATSGGGDG